MDNSSETPEIIVALLGDGGSGKTAFVTRVTDGLFNDTIQATAASEVQSVLKEFKNQQYLMKIWDNPGQDNVSHLRIASAQASEVVLILQEPNCDLRVSIEGFITEALTYGSGTLIYLVLTKSDLERSSPEFSEAFSHIRNKMKQMCAQDWQNELQLRTNDPKVTFSFFEISSKNDLGVTELLDDIIKQVMARRSGCIINTLPIKKKKCIII